MLLQQKLQPQSFAIAQKEAGFSLEFVKASTYKVRSTVLCYPVDRQAVCNKIEQKIGSDNVVIELSALPKLFLHLSLAELDG